MQSAVFAPLFAAKKWKKDIINTWRNEKRKWNLAMTLVPKLQ
jgi:hypothetical protein